MVCDTLCNANIVQSSNYKYISTSTVIKITAMQLILGYNTKTQYFIHRKECNAVIFSVYTLKTSPQQFKTPNSASANITYDVGNPAVTVVVNKFSKNIAVR